MRIRWADDCVTECNSIDFSPYGKSDEKGSFVMEGITFSTGQEFIDCDGELNMDSFRSVEETKGFISGICDKLMVDGYYDIRPDVKAGRVILY